MIKEFPHFIPVDLTIRAEINDILRVNPVSASEYNFTNLFAWAPAYGYQAASLRGGLIFLRNTGDDISMLQPVGVTEPVKALTEMISYLHDKSIDPRIERVGKILLKPMIYQDLMLPRIATSLITFICQMILIHLPGQKYHDKKNLVSQFKRKYNTEYLAMTAELARKAVDFAEEWCEQHECDEDEGLFAEKMAVMQMLENFSALQIDGGVLVENGEIIAFSLGEQHTADTYVIHAEKGISGYIGIYQAMNQKFSAANVKSLYINREQDIGVPGLRRSKESYNPIRMGKKYTIRHK